MQKLCFNCFHEHDFSDGACPHCGFDLEQQKKDYPVAITPGTMLNNRYYVGRVLGQGGFGITYVALDANINAKVAIKEFMPSELATRLDGVTVSVYSGDKADEFRYGEERFLEEARTLAQFIGNPNIAGVSNYFTENQTSYFVMDYIEGISFKSYIASMGGKVPLNDALNVMIPVLTALCAVHREGFIHRDVTPDNIFITKDGGVKLLDFGSARYSVGDRSKSLDVILKVGYAPREQYIRRGRQGPYTDVYSCAACLYASLTGFLPPESLERMDHDELVPVIDVLPDTPDYINAAILKGLAVNAEDRFQSAQEFLDAIESQTVVEIPTAQKSVVATEPSKKKNPLIIVAAILGVAIIGAGAMFALGSGTKETIVVDQNGETISSTVSKKPSGKSVMVLGFEVQSDGYFMAEDQKIGDEEFAEICSHPEIKEINLWEADTSELSDLSPVSNLTELTRLDIGSFESTYNEISTFAPLENLTKLEILRPGSCEASDVEYLKNLKNLTRLEISEMDTEDFSWAENMTQLEELRVYLAPNITSLKGLENMEKLESLNLQSVTSLTTLNGLGNKPNLLELRIRNAMLEDISAVSGASSLQELSLWCSNDRTLSNYDAVSTLTELKVIEIQVCNPEFDIEPLRNLTKLEYVYIPNNIRGAKTYSLDPIKNATNLTNLMLSAAVDDISALENLDKLTQLDLASGYTPENNLTLLQDLSPLEHMTSLRSLALNSQDITSIAPIANLTELVEFSLWDSSITDISPLLELENIKKISIHSVENISNKEDLSKYKSVELWDLQGQHSF